MTPRRKETSLPIDEAPVRFYKYVALAFLLITFVLLGLILFMSSKRATIEITTKESPVDVNLSMNIGPDAEIPGMIQTKTVTTTDFFEPTGDEQVPDIARGTIIIKNDSGTPQPLIATTRFLSSDNVLFRLESGVTVPANGSIEARVYADVPGATGNISPTKFTIPGLNETRQREVYGESTAAMTGGLRTIGILSAADVKRAEDQLVAKAIEAFKASFSSSTGTIQVLVDLISVNSNTLTQIGQEVSSFELSATIELVGVSYDSNDVQSFADASLRQREIDDAEVITPASSTPVVTFNSFNPLTETVTASVFHTGMAMLNPESKQIQKIIFFGKTRDEVRRYLLSLDHVHSVDVKFKPGWIRTVPHVHDHVNVIVKEVK
jgi:hypothetical protein